MVKEEYLSPRDKQEVAEAIRSANSGTQSNLVVVLAGYSSQYLLACFIISSVIVMPVFKYVLGPGLLYVWPGVHWTVAIAVPVISVVVLMAFVVRSPFHLKFVPKWWMRRKAKHMAEDKYFAARLDKLTRRNGVLIFVSFCERYVEVLADTGLREKIDAAEWERAVDEFVLNARAGRSRDGILAVIRKCGKALAAQFPPVPGDSYPPSRHLIEL